MVSCSEMEISPLFPISALSVHTQALVTFSLRLQHSSRSFYFLFHGCSFFFHIAAAKCSLMKRWFSARFPCLGTYIVYYYLSHFHLFFFWNFWTYLNQILCAAFQICISPLFLLFWYISIPLWPVEDKIKQNMIPGSLVQGGDHVT